MSTIPYIFLFLHASNTSKLHWHDIGIYHIIKLTIMKKVTTTPTDLLLKALDIELKALLTKDLKAFRAKQAENEKLAA